MKNYFGLFGLGLLTAWVLGSATPSMFAFQTPAPQNPQEIAFVCPDHAIDTEHEVGFFLLGAATPTSTVKLGDPALVAGEVHLLIDTRPLGLGQYEVKVRANAGTDVGVWSAAVPFARALSQPAALRIVR